jgi:hypothetical protein
VNVARANLGCRRLQAGDARPRGTARGPSETPAAAKPSHSLQTSRAGSAHTLQTLRCQRGFRTWSEA